MSKPEYIAFSNNLRSFMNKKGLTNEMLAKLLGVDRSMISNYLCAKKMPRMEKIDILCQIFNCRRSDLLDPTGDLSQDESGLIEDYRLLIPEERRIARNLVSDMAEKYKKRATGSAS